MNPTLNKRRLSEVINGVRNVKSLLKEVEANHYIPPKFRSFPFIGTQLQTDYILYLRRELRRLEVLRDGPTGIPLPKPK